MSRGAIEPAETIKDTIGHLERRIDVVEVPAEALLDAGTLPHPVLPVVQEQLDVPLDAVEVGFGEIRLAQQRVGDCKGVDAV